VSLKFNSPQLFCAGKFDKIRHLHAHKIEKNPDFLSTPPDLQKKFLSDNKRKPSNFTHLIYSLHTMKELLAKLRAPEGSSKLRKIGKSADLRFLVDIDGVAWFAQESYDDMPTAAAHYKLAGAEDTQVVSKNARCNAAGDLFFDETYSTLLKVNHKSGDFSPSFDSIKWILALLVFNEKGLPFQLPDNLLIDELNHNGGLKQAHSWPIAQIRDWLETFSKEEKFFSLLTKQPLASKTVSYKMPEHNKRYRLFENKESLPLVELDNDSHPRRNAKREGEPAPDLTLYSPPFKLRKLNTKSLLLAFQAPETEEELLNEATPIKRKLFN
jgi:hypothetical protein